MQREDFVQMVWDEMSDKADENILLGMVKEFEESDILKAAKRAVIEINERYFPRCTYDFESMIDSEINIMLLVDGTIWKLLSSKVMQKARGYTNANDGSLNYNKEDNLQFYIAIANEKKNDFIEKLAIIKYHKNIVGGFAGAE